MCRLGIITTLWENSLLIDLDGSFLALTLDSFSLLI